MIINSGTEILSEVEHTKSTNLDSNTGEGFNLLENQHESQLSQNDASEHTLIKKHRDGSIYQSPDIIIHSQDINASLSRTSVIDYIDAAAPAPVLIDKYVDESIYQSPDIIVNPKQITLAFNGTETQLNVLSEGLSEADPLFSDFLSFTQGEFAGMFESSISDFNSQYASTSLSSVNASLYSVGIAQNTNGIVDLSVRLLPVGARANTYLSNISAHRVQSASTESTNEPNFKNIAQTGNSPALAQDDPRQSRGSVTQGITTQTIASAISSQASKVESAQTLRSIEAVNNSFLLTGEIAKRHIMLTENQDGETLWYRDFEMSESSARELEERLNTSEFIRNHNIDRVFINGELLWKREA